MSHRPPAPGIAPAPAPTRLGWMDALRGVSIFLVLVNHSLVYTFDDLSAAPGWLLAFNTAFEPLRMPLMVFLSGLLVPQSLAKGTRPYVAGKLRAVIHPYFVWSAVLLACLGAASVLIGRPFDTTQLLRVFYWPLDHMWFLAYLFIYYLVALAARRINPLYVVVAVLLFAFVPGSWRWDRFWVLMAFFMLGVAAVKYRDVWDRTLSSRWAWWGAGVAFVGLFWLSTVFEDVRYTPVVSPLILACVLGACALARMVGARGWLRPARYVGRESLVYYVSHVPVILVALVLLRKLAPGAPDVVLFAAGWVIAAAAGTVLAWVATRVPGVAWLFRFGGGRARRLPVGG